MQEYYWGLKKGQPIPDGVTAKVGQAKRAIQEAGRKGQGFEFADASEYKTSEDLEEGIALVIAMRECIKHGTFRRLCTPLELNILKYAREPRIYNLDRFANELAKKMKKGRVEVKMAVLTLLKNGLLREVKKEGVVAFGNAACIALDGLREKIDFNFLRPYTPLAMHGPSGWPARYCTEGFRVSSIQRVGGKAAPKEGFSETFARNVNRELESGALEIGQGPTTPLLTLKKKWIFCGLKLDRSSVAKEEFVFDAKTAKAVPKGLSSAKGRGKKVISSYLERINAAIELGLIAPLGNDGYDECCYWAVTPLGRYLYNTMLKCEVAIEGLE